MNKHFGIVLISTTANFVQWLLTVVGTYLLLRGSWRLVRRNAEQVLKEAAYRPTVFLRSFGDEDALVAPRGLLSWMLRRRPRLEEVLISQLTRLGPAVAIGMPGERAPRLGALRAYYTDDNWQDAIRHWVDRAALVVVQAGASPSALWELTYLAGKGFAHPVVMVIPPDASEKARLIRWSAVCNAVAGTPWEAGVRALDAQSLMCVAFKPGGAIDGINGGVAHQVDYEIALQYAVNHTLT